MGGRGERGEERRDRSRRSTAEGHGIVRCDSMSVTRVLVHVVVGKLAGRGTEVYTLNGPDYVCSRTIHHRRVNVPYCTG
jgi:hypothetical protein